MNVSLVIGNRAIAKVTIDVVNGKLKLWNNIKNTEIMIDGSQEIEIENINEEVVKIAKPFEVTMPRLIFDFFVKEIEDAKSWYASYQQWLADEPIRQQEDYEAYIQDRRNERRRDLEDLMDDAGMSDDELEDEMIAFEDELESDDSFHTFKHDVEEDGNNINDIDDIPF